MRSCGRGKQKGASSRRLKPDHLGGEREKKTSCPLIDCDREKEKGGKVKYPSVAGPVLGKRPLHQLLEKKKKGEIKLLRRRQRRKKKKG